MRRKPWKIFACVALAACAGCASTGTTGGSASGDRARSDKVPAETLRAAADLIERQVYDGNREPTLGGIEGLVIDTPEIQQAVRTRAARIELVVNFLNSGHAWERPNGRLWIIRSEEYRKEATSRRRDLDAIMVNGENRDRWTIYEGIIEANGLPQSTLKDIELAFFDARRVFMTAGQKYEGPDGEPTQVQ